MRLLYYSQTNRWNDYANLAVSYMKEGKTMQTSNLENLAWNFIYQVNDPSLLNQASKYFEKAISKSSSNIQGRETYAALLYKAGNKRKALKEINTAIQLSKIKGGVYSNSLRLEGIIRSNKPIPSNFRIVEK
jgi:tetratricopeptide (TPR) repeat protein